MKKIIILGAGGHCLDIIDTINEINLKAPKYECVGILDDSPSVLGKEFGGVKVLGNLTNAIEFQNEFFVNCIGSYTNFWKKKLIIQKTQLPLERFETLIHPTASVSKFSKIGKGTVIFQNATITSNVTIGNHVIILPNSVLSHDNDVGDYTCITGGVCISGGVKIGNSCYLGTNCSIIDNITIGDNTLIGMGSTVIKSVEPNSVMVGNPASFIRNTTVQEN
jgi:sugar O-acyltransferase (sialic acid O-acetyltransferase NeuD family)